MEVVPLSVVLASQAWEEQHLELAAASCQIVRAPTSGFTGPVSGTAARFTSGWERFATTLGNSCAARADGLRAAIRDYVDSDEVSAVDLIALTAHLEERR